MGTFDEDIRAVMRSMPPGADAAQRARDIVAKQRSTAAGGPVSSAFDPASEQALPQEGPVLPSRPMQGAAPAASNIEQMIMSQLGDNVPVPTPRPDTTQQMGDASAAELAQADPKFLEAILGTQGAAPQQQLAQPAGTPFPAQSASAQGEPDADDGNSMNALIATVAGLGGAAGVAALIQRYRMGDPDAARTFAAIGMSPDDFAMFAGEPSSSIARQPNAGVVAAQAGSEDQQPQPQRAARPTSPQAPRSAAQETPKLPDMMSAPMPPWMTGKSARNLPQSRPKAKPNAKVDTKAKPKVKVKAK